MEKRRKDLIMTAAVLAAAMAVSCQKENVNDVYDSRYVGFTVNAPSSIATKGTVTSVQRAETFELSEGGVSLYVTATRTVNGDDPFTAGPRTKGTEKTKGDVGVGTDMMMFDASGSVLVSGTLGESGLSTKYWSLYDKNNKKVMWPDDAESGGAKYSFLSYVDAAGTLGGFAGGEITYSGPDARTDAAGKRIDADISEDVLVAYAKDVAHDHEAQNLVELNFYHPLAAVKFYVGAGSGVQRITLSGVKRGGKFKYNAVDPGSEDDFKDAFTWTEVDGTVEYSQDVEYPSGGGNAEVEFFLVPQEFKDAMKFTFDVENQTTHEIYQITTKASVASNVGGTSWEAGYRYNYYLGSKTEVRSLGIAVSEGWDAANYIKTNVGVTNEKRSTAYVRMAVAGNWVTEKGKVVCAFDFSGVTFNTAADDSWIAGEDGFYYYRKPLRGYATTEPLVDEFKDDTTTGSTKEGLKFDNLSNYHLVWDIVAQGVEYDEAKTYVTEAWGGATTNGGEDLIEMLDTD